MLRSRSPLISALSLLCGLLFVLQFENWPKAFVLEMEVQTDGDTTLELLYDQGAGYRQKDSVIVRLPSVRDFIQVSFHIPVAEIHNLSLLIYSGRASVRLRNVRLEMLGRQSLNFGADSIRPGKTTTVTDNGNVIEIRGPAEERSVAFTLTSSQKETRTCWRLRYGIFLGLCGGIVALVLLLPNRSKRVIEHGSRNKRLLRNTTVAFLVCVYLVSSIAKLNGSATALWRIYADRRAPRAGLIVGTAKPSRSDEWVGETPWILSQVATGFPLMNPGVGEEMMPLLNNLPARHWTMLLRPQMWAFFVADLEHAFAFYWNFKWFSFLLGAFLFLRLIARGNSLIGLFGALLLFFSPFVQWWFSTPTCMPEMIGAFFLALWSLAIIARAQVPWAITGGVIVLVQSVAQFVFCAYPRFQIPLIYLAFFLLAGALIGRRKRLLAEAHTCYRRYALLIAAALIAVILVFWYKDVGSAIARVHSLAYPGSLFSKGGELPWQRLFMPFLEFAMTEQHYPADQMNACEAAGLLFFAPLVAIAVVLNAAHRRFDPIMIASLAFVVICLWFMVVGFTTPLAKWTGFWMVYPQRMVLTVNIAAIIGLCRYLGAFSEERTLSAASRTAVITILGLMLLTILRNTNAKLAGFAEESVVIATAIYFATVFTVLWERRIIVAASLILVPTIYSNALVNPIGRGLPGLLKSETFQWLSAERSRRPDAKWLVVGNSSSRTDFLPQFVKATGADTFGGYRCEPDRRMVRALDPSRKYSAVYNRYAEIRFQPSTDSEPSFELTYVNHYNVLLPLKPEVLHRLGIGCILQIDMSPAEAVISGFSVVGERNGLRLLEAEISL